MSTVEPVQLNSEESKTEGTLPPQLPSVFDYLNYRDFLRDFYEFKKKTSRSFSLASFAEKAQIPTRNYLKRVMDGERPLSADLVPKFSRALGLSAPQSIYFEQLVRFNQTKDQESKSLYLEQLMELARTQKSKPLELAQAQYEIFANWWCFPILETCDLTNIDQSPRNLSKFFRGRITPNQVSETWELLKKLDLVKFNEATKRYEKTATQVEFVQDIRNLAVRQFHKSVLDNAKDLVETLEVDQRHCMSLTLALTNEEIVELRRRLETWMKEVNSKYSTQLENKTRVVQFNTQILNLSQEEK